MFRVLFLLLVLFGSSAFSLISKPVSTISKSIAPVPKPTTPLDTIGKAADIDVMARFDALRIILSEDSTALGYIVNYGTKSQIRKRERQIRKALAFQKIDSKRVKIVSGGNLLDFSTIIYVIPEKIEVPTP